MTGHRLPGDRGSGTILAIGMMSVLFLAASVCWVLAAGFAAHQRADVVADLAAIAAAQAAGVDCAAAVRVATANSARVEECGRSGGDVVVRVSVDAPLLLARVADLAGAGPVRVAGAARAGPR